MTSKSWDRISKVSLEKLTEMSVDDIDIIYELMVNIDNINEVEDITKLQHAFTISQFIMSYKAEDNKGLSEDLEENRIEIKKLRDMKDELEKENEALQRIDGGRDINLVREKRNWEIEKDSLAQEIKELKAKCNTLTEQTGIQEESINKHLREIESLKDERAKLGDNVEFLRQRISQQKDHTTADTNKSELAHIRSELRQKKYDLDNAQQKILELHQEIDRLKENLQLSTDEIDRMATDYRKLKNNFGVTDGDLQNTEAQCQMLKLQIEHLQEQLSDRNDTDDKIMIHVNEQVEKWKQIMNERDSEICRLYEENGRLRFDLQKSGINSEKANVQALIKLVKEREQEIQDLTKQLLDATQTIEENADLITNLKKDLDRTGGGSANHQMRRIKELRQMLDDKDKKFQDIVARLEMVENNTSDKERELVEALERNKMYEKGQFGLTEAVGELKASKAQLQVKERQMEQLCQEVNKVNYALEEIKFENGHLRSKLGIALDEQLDVEGYKRQKAAQDEEERAINIVLQKEIEKLEDERFALKKKVRVLARQAGLRAGLAGMEAGDVMDEYRTIDLEEGLATKNEETIIRSSVVRRTESASISNTWKIKEKEINKELFQALKDLEKRDNEIAQMSARNAQLKSENDALFEGVREIKEEWRSRQKSTVNSKSELIECPVLDKLLVAMETKKLIGDFDTGTYVKTRIDNLEGRNDELRNELRNTRVEYQKLLLDYDKVKQRLKVMEPIDVEVDNFELTGLPENMTVSANQTIAALNQHLILVLQEKSLKEAALEKVDKALDNYRRKFALVRHQQGLLYRQYAEEKAKYESEIQSLQSKLINIDGIRLEEGVRIAEFNKLLDNLNQDEGELKQRLGDLSRQVTVLKVNEVALTRRYGAMQEMEETLRKENNKLKNEMIQIEAVVTDRMGYYRRFKETANYKLNVLQKELDESVPSREMSKLQTRFDELTEKYRTFLEKQNVLISRGESIIQIESELNKIKIDHEALKKVLETEKQRRNILEAAFEEMGESSSSLVSNEKSRPNLMPSPRKRGGPSSTVLNDAHLISISKRMTTVEMKEINERERADHAVRMYDNIKQSWNSAEKRNKELEEKLSQLTNANLELQKIERELRDELVDSVSKEINDQQKWKVLDLEKGQMESKHEIEQLKEIAEIATMQTKAFQQQQMCRDKEVSSLRQQLLDIQCQTDEKSLIGKLHRHIVHLQLSETSALRKLDDSQRIEKRLQCQLLNAEQHCDEKDQSLYQNRLEARARVKHLKDTVQSLRSQFSGCIPLSRQERFTGTLVQLTEEKAKLDQQLQKVIHEKFDMETELDSIKLVNGNRQELVEALKNRKNEKNVLELWNKKMEELRLECLKHKRQTDLLQHEVEHLDSVIKCQESQLSQVDQDIVRITKDHDEKQLIWEQREDELERIINYNETMQGEVIIAAHSFQEAQGKKQYLGTMPDSDAPLPNQLEQAVGTIKNNIRIIFEKESENKSLRKLSKEQENKIRELEATLLKRERYINELRLRLPATEDRVEKMSKISEAAAASLLNPEKSNYVDEKTMWAAQTTLTSLQERLQAKEESLMRLESLLKEAREDLVNSNQRHAEEMRHLKTIYTSAQTTQGKLDYSPPPKSKIVTSEQFRENNELRDLLVIQTRNNEDLKFHISELQRQLSSEKLRNETNEKLFNSRLRDADMKLENDMLDLKENVNNLKKKLNEKDNQVEYQSQEIARLKADLVRSPKAEMKSAVTKLAEQLRDKDKQLQTLKTNLADVKKTIADQSMDALRMTKDDMSKQENIQKILDKHTKDLSNELEANRDQILQYQRELRSTRADRERVQIELDGLKADVDHKESQYRKFKSDKGKLEQDNEDLRNQLQRIKNLRNLSTNDAVKQELEATKTKLHLIEEENRNLRKPAAGITEKSGVNRPKPIGGDIVEDKFTLWENEKKNQKIQDKLKEKLAEKESEIVNQAKQIDAITKAMDRLRREKQVLENRLTNKWGPGALLDIDRDIQAAAETFIVPEANSKTTFAAPSNRPYNGNNTVAMDELRRQNMELERKINKFCRDTDTGDASAANAVALKDAEMRNRILQKNIEDLERSLVQSGNISAINLEKERAMQKEIMRLNSENLQLKFEVEAGRKEIPRLKEKIEDLKKYIDLLKSEKDELLMDGKSNRSFDSSASTLSNIRRIGESGKSVKELEKMIGRMKKVVEKTQRENEKLKEAPGVVLNEKVQQVLMSENAALKSELEHLKNQMGQKLTERYDSKERGLTKLVGDYEKIRLDLSKECKDHEKTRIDLKQLAREMGKLEARNLDLESKLTLTEQRGSRNVPRMTDGELRDENRRLSTMNNVPNQESDRHIDELRSKYKKSIERNSVLEKQLKNLSEQFGVAIDLRD